MLEDYLFLFIQPPSAVVRGPFLSPFSLLWRRSKRNLGSGSSMNQRENILIHSSAHTFWVLSTFFYFLFLFQNKKWKTQPSSLIFLQSPWINLLKKMWEQKGSIKCFIIVYTTAFGGRAGTVFITILSIVEAKQAEPWFRFIQWTRENLLIHSSAHAFWVLSKFFYFFIPFPK